MFGIGRGIQISKNRTVGGGQKKKALADKLTEGNPGKRKQTVNVCPSGQKIEFHGK